jgi:tripeptide aminopeptidase
MPTRKTLAMLFLALSGAQAQTPDTGVAALVQRPDVRRGLDWLTRNLPRQRAEWAMLTEIPAPSRHEKQRAAYVARELRKLGLVVDIDSIGNVIARRPGRGGGPLIVLAAHLDTVHPESTDVRVRYRGDTLRAPGVFDNSMSVANLLAVARALNRATITTRGDVVFVATTQEELGFRGMAYYLEHAKRKPDMVVALDGGFGPVWYGALGIFWSRYRFIAAGAHTVNSTGKPHPARALADAVTAIYRNPPPEGGAESGAVFNVGMLRGGEVANAIPREVSFTMDLRSANPVLLDSLDRLFDAEVSAAAARHRVEWKKDTIQRSDAGGTAAVLAPRLAHPLTQSAIALQRYLGIVTEGPVAEATGSTDANAAVIKGIPAISIGRGVGGDQHTLNEWADASSLEKATHVLLLLTVRLADQLSWSDEPATDHQEVLSSPTMCQ